jgi:hypothetical protein
MQSVMRGDGQPPAYFATVVCRDGVECVLLRQLAAAVSTGSHAIKRAKLDHALSTLTYNKCVRKMDACTLNQLNAHGAEATMVSKLVSKPTAITLLRKLGADPVFIEGLWRARAVGSLPPTAPHTQQPAAAPGAQPTASQRGAGWTEAAASEPHNSAAAPAAGVVMGAPPPTHSQRGAGWAQAAAASQPLNSAAAPAAGAAIDAPPAALRTASTHEATAQCKAPLLWGMGALAAKLISNPMGFSLFRRVVDAPCAPAAPVAASALAMAASPCPLNSGQQQPPPTSGQRAPLLRWGVHDNPAPRGGAMADAGIPHEAAPPAAEARIAAGGAVMTAVVDWSLPARLPLCHVPADHLALRFYGLSTIPDSMVCAAAKAAAMAQVEGLMEWSTVPVNTARHYDVRNALSTGAWSSVQKRLFLFLGYCCRFEGVAHPRLELYLDGHLVAAMVSFLIAKGTHRDYIDDHVETAERVLHYFASKHARTGGDGQFERTHAFLKTLRAQARRAQCMGQGAAGARDVRGLAEGRGARGSAGSEGHG